MEQVQTEALTVEQKKALAEKAKLEAKQKREADKNAEKVKKDAAKAAAGDQKRTDAIAAIGVSFTALQGYQAAVNTAVTSLTAESTVEQVNTVIASTESDVKLAKEALKSIKTVGRKFKDDADISTGVTTAEAIMTAILASVDPLKDHVKNAKLAAKEAERAEAKRIRDEAKAASAQPSQNDVTRPRPETACGQAWALMDELTTKLNSPAPIGLVLQASEKKGLNYDTVKTQYARWKKFNGIVGRVAMPLPEGLLD